MILVLSHAADDHAAAVGAELDREGAAWALLDLRRLPSRPSLALGYGGRGGRDFRLFLEGGRALRPDRVAAVWWRRPGSFAPDPAMRPTHRDFAAQEWHQATHGLWRALPARWVNPPGAEQAASYKTWQLAAAQDAGFRVPRTLVTNDPARARDFLRAQGRRPTVYKAFHGAPGERRWVRLVGRAERALLEAVRHAPVVFQEYVGDAVDVRVTVAGTRLFATAVDARRSAYPVDFRADWAGARVEPCRLPSPVEGRVRSLVRRMGLAYAALDLRRRPDGEHVFLELNPTGQWLGFERRSGQPISRAVARLLAGPRRRRGAGTGC